MIVQVAGLLNGEFDSDIELRFLVVFVLFEAGGEIFGDG